MAADERPPYPLPIAPIYMIAGDDADGDCHVVFTDSAMRAIGHFKHMTGHLCAVRGNENFELLRPLIANFETDGSDFGAPVALRPAKRS